MTSKQRAYLKSMAVKIEPVMQIGKATVTPELTKAVQEALEARELIKLHVLKNCVADAGSIAQVLAERTHSPGCSGDRQKNCSLQRITYKARR